MIRILISVVAVFVSAALSVRADNAGVLVKKIASLSALDLVFGRSLDHPDASRSMDGKPVLQDDNGPPTDDQMRAADDEVRRLQEKVRRIEAELRAAEEEFEAGIKWHIANKKQNRADYSLASVA